MKKENENPKTPKVVRITSAKQLQTLVDATLPCRFKMDGEWVEVAVTRLSAGTSERAREIMRAPKPPFNKALNSGQGDYDAQDRVYLQAVDKAGKTARSVIVYAHCPIIAESKPGLLAPADIHAHVSGMFSEQILELLSMTIQAGGVTDIADGANFT